MQIPPMNVEELVRLIQNPELRKRMGKAGREKMQREFDERLVVEKTLRVHQQGRL